MVVEGNEKLERTKPSPGAGTKTSMKPPSKAGTKTSMKQGSQAKQPEETPEIAAAVEYLRTRRGMTNHDIQDALSTYGSGLVVMHQQALHTDRIAMAHQNRL